MKITYCAKCGLILNKEREVSKQCSLKCEEEYNKKINIKLKSKLK